MKHFWEEFWAVIVSSAKTRRALLATELVPPAIALFGAWVANQIDFAPPLESFDAPLQEGSS